MALVVALLIPVLGLQSATASRVKTSAVAWSQLTASTQVWILGNQIHAYECLAKPSKAALSLKASNGWMEVAHTVAALDPQFCSTSSAPFAAKYEFILMTEGQLSFPGTQARLLVYKIKYSQGSRQATSAVYESSDEVSQDQIDGKLPGSSANDEQGQKTNTFAVPRPFQSKFGATPLPSKTGDTRTISGWSGCSFNGVPMSGRVKVVSVGAQFKIRLVGSNASLMVKGVTRPAKRCGEWQFVSATPAFTVEIVRTGEDFTVSLGAAHPGLKP